jgi:hypothetical protein
MAAFAEVSSSQADSTIPEQQEQKELKGHKNESE